MTELRFGSHAFETSNLDKPLFPDAGIAKGNLLDYYRDFAEIMLPYLRERPLVMHRFPDGIDADGFYQKQVPEHFPDWIETVTVGRQDGGEITHVVCNNTATLAYLAQQACITLHPWLSRVNATRLPDRVIFDLDPAPGDPDEAFAMARNGARILREILAARGLTPYVMTTGSRGLHVVAPIRPTTDFDTVRDFAREIANALVERDPRQFTAEQRKDRRGSRLFVDYLRNAYAQTAVAPYAVRALPDAPVATPLDWDELGGSGLHARRYTIHNIGRRLARKPDPWIDMDRHAGDLKDG